MNDAKTYLDTGNLTAAVESALNQVKARPADAPARTFLFELSCFSGDWERAEKQLDVIGHQSAASMIGAKVYEQNFKAERDRTKLFSDGQRPETAMPLPSYAVELLKANDMIREGKTAEARALLDEIEENRPAFPCTINGEDFSDFRDYNDATMCVFELIVKDLYVWLPFEQVEKIEFLQRKSLRDVFWPQAAVTMTNGTNGEMFLPSLYVNSWKHNDDQVRLGRTVDWRDAGDEIYIGEGTRLFTMDGKDKSILDIQTIEFRHD